MRDYNGRKLFMESHALEDDKQHMDMVVMEGRGFKAIVIIL